jgi:uncharacterized membrane protein YidH (DUF202 family)
MRIGVRAVNKQPWDTGLQVERTALAWLRTCLAFVVVALFAFHYASRHSLPLALGLAAIVAPLGLLSIWLAWRRYRTSAARLAADRPLPDAILAAAVTVVTVLTGLLGLAYVLLER